MTKCAPNNFKPGDRVTWRTPADGWAEYTIHHIEGDRLYDSSGAYLPYWEVMLVDGEAMRDESAYCPSCGEPELEFGTCKYCGATANT